MLDQIFNMLRLTFCCFRKCWRIKEIDIFLIRNAMDKFIQKKGGGQDFDIYPFFKYLIGTTISGEMLMVII